MELEEIIQKLSPALSARVLTQEQKEAFEQGLEQLEGARGAKNFVADCRRFRDYHRRVRSLLTYLQTFNTAGNSSTTAAPRRHVGRPTKDEQEAYAEWQKQKRLEEARNSLFPELKPDVSLRPLTFGGIVANPDGESIAATMPTLAQIRPFLSPTLQEQVNNVRTLRNEMASKAEQAKTMAEANKRAASTVYPKDEIAKLTKRVVEIESHILPDIYTAVDREMGECYLRLSRRTGDPEYIAYIELTVKADPQALRTQFKPFYEKAQARDPQFAQSVADKIAADRPEVKAARDAAAKHKAEADVLIKYIIRKDKPSTRKRVQGLKERLDKLRKDYSDIVTEDELTGYEAILTKTIREAEK